MLSEITSIDNFLWIESIALFLSISILAVGLFQNTIYFLQIPLAAIELLKVRNKHNDEDTPWLLQTDLVLPISIIIPAYNEEVTILETVTASLSMKHPSFRVIVVNDGSKDQTLEILKQEFDLYEKNFFHEDVLKHKPIKNIYMSDIYSSLIVVDKENGGRSDALNVGIDICKTPLFCTLDADSILDPTALLNTIQPFIDDPERTVASGGTVRVLNGCDVNKGHVTQMRLPKKFLARFQIVEYMRAFLMGRLAWSKLGMVTLISGAFAVFRRDMVVDVGGFDQSTLAEDFELVIKIHHHCRKNKINYKMKFVPEPVCWTEVPESLKVLRSQRVRWQQGGIEVFFKYWKMFLNPRYGRIGVIAFPIIFILDIIGPLVELIGVLLLPIFLLYGFINLKMMTAFFAVFFIFGVFISVMSLVLEELSLRRFSHAKGLLILGYTAIVENFGYRQLNNLWRIIGWWRFFSGKQVWGEMQRVGTKANN